MKSLKGKVVLITGASSGIGRAAAQAFAQAGCSLSLGARRADKVAELARSLKAEGASALELSLDVRQRPQVAAAVARTKRRFGRLDILVNNAGILESKPLEEQDIAVIEDILRTNLLGAIYAIKAALPLMRRQRSGHILNVASVAGIFGLPFMAAYSASKFALVGLGESLRRELRGTGVALTTFCPGVVRTPMAELALKDPELSKLARPKTPEQVAQKMIQAVLYESPEVIYGDAPETLLRLSKFFPRWTDWAVHRIYTRRHPLARGRRRVS